jgi:hypothetical protein
MTAADLLYLATGFLAGFVLALLFAARRPAPRRRYLIAPRPFTRHSFS